MKRTGPALLLLAFVLTACSSSSEVLLKINNPLDEMRKDASLVITRKDMKELTQIPDNLLPAVQEEDGNFLPCQADDLDGDGSWDELFALIDMEAAEEKNIRLVFLSPEDYPLFEARTNIHLGNVDQQYAPMEKAERLEKVSYHNYEGRTSARFQLEGPGWENDRVGFRNYFDQRNGMDIFGKTTGEMVLQDIGLLDGPSYHEPGPWGMDVLKVGTSLGAGAIAYRYQDSLYRVGDNGNGSFRIALEGDFRSRFHLTYSNWQLSDLFLNVDHEVEIQAGKHYYQGSASFQGTDQKLALVPGIVNMHSEQAHVMETDGYTILLTHDRQAEDGSILAMALMAPSTRVLETGQCPDDGEGIIQTYTMVLDAGTDEKIGYRFYALWEHENPDWAELEKVSVFLEKEARYWAHPLQVN